MQAQWMLYMLHCTKGASLSVFDLRNDTMYCSTQNSLNNNMERRHEWSADSWWYENRPKPCKAWNWACCLLVACWAFYHLNYPRKRIKRTDLSNSFSTPFTQEPCSPTDIPSTHPRSFTCWSTLNHVQDQVPMNPHMSSSFLFLLHQATETIGEWCTHGGMWPWLNDGIAQMVHVLRGTQLEGS